MPKETLLGQSRIWLFGRPLADITLNLEAFAEDTKDAETDEEAELPRGGENHFLLNQLAPAAPRDKKSKDKPLLARIYAFGFEGQIFDMTRPAIFLVHGKGKNPEGPKSRVPEEFGDLDHIPPHTGRTGVASQTGHFAKGIKVWAYDRADFTMRLDVENGSFDAVLLEAELGDPTGQSAGSFVRSAGSFARSAGSFVRSAGSFVRPRRRRDDSE
ncbi:hypothetical protein [Mesorhizobium xinjiangense]|uniref:hypothetical protein n=1 Tax=Mesorhizobium xinjiangense TaxID=2678685 RepID=UPI0012ECCB72|nr:hypothetical protein [Mesorhizobium xinjiangense]